jgi:hypothetical protein
MIFFFVWMLFSAGLVVTFHSQAFSMLKSILGTTGMTPVQQSTFLKSGDEFFNVVATGNAKAVSDLIKSGTLTTKAMELGQATHQMKTPLHVACEFNFAEVVAVLLEVPGLDIDITSANRQTPLSIACEKGHSKIIELLMAKHADPTITTARNRNCLWYAVYSQNMKAVESLMTLWPLRDDTDLYCIDYKGFSQHETEGSIDAADLARHFENDEMVAFIDHMYAHFETRVKDSKFSTDWPARVPAFFPGEKSQKA